MLKAALFFRRIPREGLSSDGPRADPVPQPSKIFISYSRKDASFAREFTNALDSHDFDTWIDWEDIPFTAEWLQEIYAGIEAADSFVFVISPDSIGSDACLLELNHAVTHKKRLIPVVCREVEPARAPAPVASLNWIFFCRENDFHTSFQFFIRAIEIDLAYAKAVTRLLVRALEWERKGHDVSLLLRGKDLRDAEELLAESTAKIEPKPTQRHTEFVLASRQYESKRQRKIITAVTVGLAVTISLAAVSFILYRMSETRAKIATSRQLAAQSLTLLDSELDLALLLSVEASRIYDTAEARSSLITALEYSPALNAFYHGHNDIVYSLAFSPDGKILASASADGTLILWDTHTGKQIHSLDKHDGAVYGVTFNPDGKTIASAGSDNTIILWDVVTGMVIGEPIQGPSMGLSGESIRSVSFSLDGKWLAAGSSNGHLVLWNPQNPGLAPKRFEQGLSPVASLAFSPDSLKLISIDENDSIRIWDVATSKLLSHTLPERIPKNSTAQERVRLSYSTGFDFKENSIAAGTEEGDVFLADLDSPDRAGTFLSGHSATVTSVAFSGDGKLLASCSRDRTVILRDALTGAQIGQPLKGHSVWVSTLAFSPDGKTLASGSNDGDVIIWGINRSSRLGATLKVQTGLGEALAFSADNKLLAFADNSNEIQLWDVEKNGPYGEPLLGSPGEIIRIAFGGDGTTVASCHRNGQVLVWKLAPEQRANPYLKWQIDRISHAAFSADGSMLLTGTGQDNSVVLWNVSTGQKIGSSFEGHKEVALCMTFSNDNKLLVSGGQDKTVLLWSTDTHQPVSKPLTVMESFVFSVAISPDKKTVAAGDEDGVIYLWDISSGKRSTIPPRGYDGFVWSLVFSPDGIVLASGDEQGTVHLWNASTGKRFGIPLKQHRERISLLAFSSDGNSLASLGQDRSIAIWDLSIASWQTRALQIANRNFQDGER